MEAETPFDLLEQQFAVAGTWKLLDNLDAPSLEDLEALGPNGAGVQLQLARDFVRAGQLDRATAAAIQSLELAPESPDAHALTAALLIETGDAETAAEHLDYVTETLPRWAEAWRMRGEAAFRVGDLDTAADAMQTALSLRPTWPEASFRLGEILLKLGDYPSGWALYESRWSCAGYVPLDSLAGIPKYDGHQSLEGKRIVVVAEQGMGDLIHYIRYAQILRDRGATVIVTCPSELTSLLTTAPGIAAAVPFGMMLPPVHYQVPLLSLPFLLGTMLGSARATVPYLSARESLRQSWSRRVDELALPDTKRVGVVWSGLSTHPYNAYRSITLPMLQPMFDVQGISWFSLQKGPAAGDLLECDSPLIDVSPDLQSFEHTAAAIEALDLVISVDTAVAHLCGALNHDGWLLLHTGSDYRWLTEADRTPWYPSLHLFRQEQEGSWLAPVERIAEHLMRWVKQESR
ncbi:MAG: tetratricopeptide repeat protein [Tepidisphaeraceae bacterium]